MVLRLPSRQFAGAGGQSAGTGSEWCRSDVTGGCGCASTAGGRASGRWLESAGLIFAIPFHAPSVNLVLRLVITAFISLGDNLLASFSFAGGARGYPAKVLPVCAGYATMVSTRGRGGVKWLADLSETITVAVPASLSP